MNERREYARAALVEGELADDPIEQLRAWLDEAAREGVHEANAMCLATIGEEGPSARMVLLRGLDVRGLHFYTSYFSRKSRDLAFSARCAVVFHWPLLERQVRVEGDVERASEEESDAYFAGRPRGHQLGAWASEQSEPIDSAQMLEQRMRDYDARFEDEEVPRPHSWGGYVIHPRRIEFWQGRPDRLHDRIEYVRDGSRWTKRRLQP